MMAAHVVDGQLKKEDTIRLPFDEDIFGHDSFTAMVVYAAQSGTGKVKLNWVNTV
ncbi:hypothetical protein M8C21_026347, partial [Ambrosia artemisiifolia]